MKLKKDDTVIIIAGKDKGKEGKVLKTFAKRNKIVVEKVNMRTKHIRKTAQRPGEKIQYEAEIDASNAMLKDPKTGKPSRVGYKIEGGKKIRFSKKSGETLDNLTKK